MVKIAEMGQKVERIGLKIDKNGLNQKSKTKLEKKDWAKLNKTQSEKYKVYWEKELLIIMNLCPAVDDRDKEKYLLRKLFYEIKENFLIINISQEKHNFTVYDIKTR